MLELKPPIKPLKTGDVWEDKENKKVMVYLNKRWVVDDEATLKKWPKRRTNGKIR